MWRIWLANQKDFAVYARVDFNSANRTFYVGKNGIQGPIRVYSSTYTVHWYEYDSGQYINSETVALTSDYAFFTPRQAPEGPPGGPGTLTNETLNALNFLNYVVQIQNFGLITLGLISIGSIFGLIIIYVALSGKITRRPSYGGR